MRSLRILNIWEVLAFCVVSFLSLVFLTTPWFLPGKPNFTLPEINFYIGQLFAAFFISLFASGLISLFSLLLLPDELRKKLSQFFMFWGYWPVILFALFFSSWLSENYYVLYIFYALLPTGLLLKTADLPRELKQAIVAFGGKRKDIFYSILSFERSQVIFFLWLHFLRISSDFLTFFYLYLRTNISFPTNPTIFLPPLKVVLVLNLSFYLVFFFFSTFLMKKKEDVFAEL
ncbi:MAG: hypothetical protein NZM25_08670 [Leptospiraceae bacterium]|nr:hypothetical protein [Leptospiraceae bacterium]MDW8306790.1 hypothetical protein [Leptospiraceae bacterium]